MTLRPFGTSTSRTRALFEGWLIVIPPCLAALYPLVFILRSHAHTHLFGLAGVVRPAAALCAFAMLMLLLFRWGIGTWRSSSVAATAFFVFLGLFPAIFGRSSHGALVPVGFLLACAIVAVLVTRLLGAGLGLALSWASAIVVLWVAASTLIVVQAWWPIPAWREPVKRIAAHARSFDIQITGRAPDIYYVVLDGMGRPDVLERLYGLDVTVELRRLEALGVKVPSRARSNYSQTQLSLASAMNMQYLTELAPAMGDELDRRPLNELIVTGGVMARLKEHGYEFVVVGSTGSITSQHVAIDRCFCRLPDGPTELEHALVRMMPFRGERLEHASISAHGRQVRRVFDVLESVESSRPMFVMAHVVAPHPPFALSAYGSERIGQDLFTYFDGDGFPGSRDAYVAGYREQARFVLNRTVALLERIVARSPEAIVVIHSDHGPGLGLVNTDARLTDVWERLSIFSAYYAGGRDATVADDTSPVNALRWALRAGLSADLPNLPDRSYMSDYVRPYQWREIPAEPSAGAGSR